MSDNENPQAEQKLGKVYDRDLVRRLYPLIAERSALFWGAAALLPLVALCSTTQPYLIKNAIDQALLTGKLSQLAPSAVGYLLALGVELGGRLLQFYWLVSLGEGVIFHLRQLCFRKLMRAPMAFYLRHPVGRLVTRVTNDMDNLNELFVSGIIAIVQDLFSLIFYVVVMLYLSTTLTLMTLAFLPVLLVGAFVLRQALRASFRSIRIVVARLNSFLQEAINGIMVVKLFGQEAAQQQQFARINREYRDGYFFSVTRDAQLYSFVETISTLAIAAILWYGGQHVAPQVDMQASGLTIGILFAFIEYSQRFFIPLRDLASKIAVMQNSMASLERIAQLLDQPEEASEKDCVLPAPLVFVPGTPRIEFRNVSFAYDDRQQVLQDISFAVYDGESVGIVGPTGSGKSTIFKLLLKFFGPYEGEIFLNAREIRGLPPDVVRREIGMVMQDPMLSSGTLLENVAFGLSADSTAHEAEGSLERLGLAEFVSVIRDRMGQRVGEKGKGVSLGEAQLMALARAVMTERPILLLDEATAHVDPQHEWLLTQSISNVMRERTSLIIAHRLSTVQHLKRIIVLVQGKIREIGTHDDLLRADRYYATLTRAAFV